MSTKDTVVYRHYDVRLNPPALTILQSSTRLIDGSVVPTDFYFKNPHSLNLYSDPVPRLQPSTANGFRRAGGSPGKDQIAWFEGHEIAELEELLFWRIEHISGGPIHHLRPIHPRLEHEIAGTLVQELFRYEHWPTRCKGI